MHEKILWVFLHPPRTGGNTIIEALLKKFPREEIYMASLARYKLDQERFIPDKVRFMLGHATYYGIHKLVPDKTPRYFIFLRDPAERIASFYNFKMQHEKKIIPFNRWYNHQMKNEIVHFLNLKLEGSESTKFKTPKLLLPVLRKLNYKTYLFLEAIINKFRPRGNEKKKLENAKKLLDLCWFIGISEKSDDDFKFLLKEMGVKNPGWINDGVSKKIIKVDDKFRQKIYRENPLDLELYNYALKLRESKIKSLKKSR